MVDLLRRRSVRSMAPWVVIAVAVLLAFAVRFLFVDDVSGDYRSFLSPWYDHLAQNGGFAAVGGDFSNYNPPYLYLLAAVTYLPLPKIVAIKLISMVADVVLATFAALLVRQKFNRPTMWATAFVVVLFAPTVVVNSAVWGQCDSIYAACCLGSLYFLLRRKPWWACIFFGLAIGFKLQAVFFLPVLLIVLVVNRQRLLALLAVPATFAVMLLPAVLAGRDLTSLLMIYPNQVSTGGTATAGLGRAGAGAAFGGGRAGQSTGAVGALTQNAPTFYQWVGSSAGWKYLGLAAAGLLLVGLAGSVYFRRRPLGRAEIVLLAAFVVLAVPFQLPQMHERYFYLADVLTIVTAFYVRRYWPVAVVVSACSLLSYAPFLWNRTFVALPLVAFAEFLAVIVTGWLLVAVLRGDTQLLRRPAVTGPGAHPVPA